MSCSLALRGFGGLGLAEQRVHGVGGLPVQRWQYGVQRHPGHQGGQHRVVVKLGDDVRTWPFRIKDVSQQQLAS